MNDQTVEPQRRDRAAQALLPFCHARPPGQPASYNYVPKRDEAERKAKWAGYGSPWWELLTSTGAEDCEEEGRRPESKASGAEEEARFAEGSREKGSG